MKRLVRRYWKIIEKDTGYLVGIVPYIYNKDHKEYLNQYLKLFYKVDSSYEGVEFKIILIKKLLQNEDN